MSGSSTISAEGPLDADVVILGAGIGGLAAALALRQAGIMAQVYERADILGPVGGAVVTREPVVRLLEAWGVASRFHAEAVLISMIEARDEQGRPRGTVTVDPLGEGRAYSVHRADLHALLLSGVDARDVHRGMEVVGVVDGGDHGAVHFKGGRRVRAKVVIGADGIKSVARKAIIEDDLVFSKLVVLRGLAPFSAMPANMKPDRLYMWGQDKRMMLTLPLRSGADVAMDTAIVQDQPPEHLWTSEIPMPVLLAFFEGFDPDLLALIRAGTVPVRANPVFEREPIDRWSTGHITLLGDAAHPMQPKMGQGANQAILDAESIARALAGDGMADVPAALRRYQAERAPLTRKIQLGSRLSPTIDVASVA